MKRKMWSAPWGWKESGSVVAGLLAVGGMLQAVAGNFPFVVIRYPVNLILGGMCVALIVFAVQFRRSDFYKWVSGVPLASLLLLALCLLGIIMGLTIQPIAGGMASSWPFVLLYLATLFSLGTVLARRLVHWNLRRDYGFLLNHAGLWVLLFAAGFGYADTQRYVMYVQEGEVEWRVYDAGKNALELPVAIRLHDFRMEEYLPKLVVIDRNSGAVYPPQKPAFWQIDTLQRSGNIARWEIELLDFLPLAVRNADGTYREVAMPAATAAARIRVRDGQKSLRVKEEQKEPLRGQTELGWEGWVCAGNGMQNPAVLNLDEQYAVAMTAPDAKRFASHVTLYSRGGKQAEAVIEVNKPYKMGSWMFYQYGYDNQAGPASAYSSFELVYDPWIVPVYIGIILLALGSVCMLWGGNLKKEVTDDLG